MLTEVSEVARFIEMVGWWLPGKQERRKGELLFNEYSSSHSQDEEFLETSFIIM